MRRKGFLKLGAAFALMTGGKDLLAETAAATGRTIRLPQEALDPKGGHIQGIALGDGAIFLSQMTQITKLDLAGRLLAKRRVTSHTGDLTWWQGELYTSVAIFPAAQEGRIEVFDKDLNPVRSAPVDRAIDGIACLDGVLYVGMGARDQPSKDPHRVNVLGRFDAQTLKEVAPRQMFDYGVRTHYGVQDLATDGRLLYATFYAVGGPQMAVFDKTGQVVGVSDAGSSTGFDFLPAGRGLLVHDHRKGLLREESLPVVRAAK